MTITTRFALEVNAANVADHMSLRLHLVKVKFIIVLEIQVTDLAVIMLGFFMDVKSLPGIEATAAAVVSAWKFPAEVS